MRKLFQLVALLLIMVSPAFATITTNHVSLPASSSAASPTAFTITTTTGNCYILTIHSNMATTVSAVTDSKSNTYTLIKHDSDGTHQYNNYIYMGSPATSGATTVTITHASTGLGIAFYDNSATSGSCVLDTAAASPNGWVVSAFATSANPAPSITTVTAGDFVVCVLESNTHDTTAVASPFTWDNIDDNNTVDFGSGSHDTNSGSGTLTSTFTMTSTGWATIMAAFKESGAAASHSMPPVVY